MVKGLGGVMGSGANGVCEDGMLIGVRGGSIVWRMKSWSFLNISSIARP